MSSPTGESRDRVVDALLTQHLAEQPFAMESRYARAFQALDAADSARARSTSRRHAFRLARAAMIALFAGVMLVLLPVESSASTVLAAAANAEARARTGSNERRYEVEVCVQRDRWLRGNWDMRGTESRLELRPSGGPDAMPSLIRADSADGAWEMREGQPARMLETHELWPRWVEEHNGAVAVERMDQLLRLVQRSYEFVVARGGSESPAALRGAMHLLATRRDDARGPDEIDLWIDNERNVVLEARLRWSHPPRGPVPPPRGSAPPPPPHGAPNDYRAAPGALPPFPPEELRLHRIEPIVFPADHFTMPRING